MASASSFHIIKDVKATSLKLRSGAPITRSYNINYLDNWAPQTNLIIGDPFKVQIVAIGNLVTLSWDTVPITSGGGGPVAALAFATKIPSELIPNLRGEINQGQNFPITIDNSTQFIMWIDVDGTINVDPTDTNTDVIPTGSSISFWGSSVTWTTNND